MLERLQASRGALGAVYIRIVRATLALELVKPIGSSLMV